MNAVPIKSVRVTIWLLCFLRLQGNKPLARITACFSTMAMSDSVSEFTLWHQVKTKQRNKNFFSPHFCLEVYGDIFRCNRSCWEFGEASMVAICHKTLKSAISVYLFLFFCSSPPSSLFSRIFLEFSALLFWVIVIVHLALFRFFSRFWHNVNSKQLV